MPYTLKTQQISVKDPDSGEYIGVDVLTEQTKEGLIAELQAEGNTQVARINQAASDVQSAVDQAETEAQQLISSTQSSLNTLETQKDTIAQTIASMAELGTDTALTTAGMAADAKKTGDEISNVKNALNTDIYPLVDTNINLFNKATATDGYRMKSDGTTELVPGLFYTDYFPIKKSTTYITKYNSSASAGAMVLYNSSKTRIGSVNGERDGNYVTYTTTSAASTAFGIITNAIEEKDTLMLVEGTSYPSVYKSYNTIVLANSVPLSGKQEQQVNEKIYKLIDTNKNLFDKTAATLNKKWKTDGTIENAPGIFYTDFIPIAPNETVITKYSSVLGAYSAIAYKSDKTTKVGSITGVRNGDYVTYTMSSAASIAYIVINSSIDLIDGLMIVKGTTYPPVYRPYNVDVLNDVYPLTGEQDKQVNEKIEKKSSGLPPYWRTEINSKIPGLVAKDALIGNDGDSFIFITDVHIPQNRLYSPALIKYILKSTSVEKVFFGGDLLDKDIGTSGKSIAEGRLTLWNYLMKGTGVFNIIGNHENNNYDGNNSDNIITISELYGILDKRNEKWTDKKTYYVVDNDTQKIRYIILNDVTSVNSGIDYPGVVLPWMQEKLTELEAGWKAVVMQHAFWSTIEEVGQTPEISSRGELLESAINAVYDSLNCTFIGVIVGHTHIDYAIYDSEKGYPIIGVNCDCMDDRWSGYTRIAGTTSEQSFDVAHLDFANRKIYLTRIGAGSDREFKFNQNDAD